MQALVHARTRLLVRARVLAVLMVVGISAGQVRLSTCNPCSRYEAAWAR
jgi:hypothetical protein